MKSCRRLKLPVRDYMAAILPGLPISDNNRIVSCLRTMPPLTRGISASQTHVQPSNPFSLDSVRKYYSHTCKSPGSLTQQHDARSLCSETHLNPRRPSK